ncbi:MAG TPA: hypothetical protein VG603_13900, partial [Chitinophagales bacterium]|nr:hypothetical protein [Chitinophagales bacterium]
MPKRFRWILTCTDNNTSYELEKDPVNWAECSYRLERHQVYKGVFNKFTSSLKFHSQGGGKQFIDNIYSTYDIDGNINIEVLVDTDGNGKNYDTLFNGKLNLASYSTDGTYTTVNVEASDIITKLNTRADIPVALNIPTVKAGFYPNHGGWISYTFKGALIATVDAAFINSGSGIYIFTDPAITTGNFYCAQITDGNDNPLTSRINYDGVHNTGDGTVNGTTGVSIRLWVNGNGEMQVDFTGANGIINLYCMSNRQISLGQKSLQGVDLETLKLPGIPIQYQSAFVMVGDVNSGSYTFTQGSDGWPTDVSIQPGDLITAIIVDSTGSAVSSQVVFTGNTTQGPLALSDNGQSNIRFTIESSTRATVTYRNTYAPIGLFKGAITGLGAYNLGSYTAIDNVATQVFNSNTLVPALGNDSVICQFCFDAVSLFDNFNQFAFGAYSNFITPGESITSYPTPICAGLTDNNITYPVQVNYSIKLKGTVKDTPGYNNYPHKPSVNFWLAFGGRNATDTSPAIILATKLKLISNEPPAETTNFSWDFDIHPGLLNCNGYLSLQPGDQVWLYCSIEDNIKPAFPGAEVYVGFTFEFSESYIEFNIIENAAATECETIMVHEAFNQVVDSIADSDGNFYSSFYGRTDSQKRSYAKNGAGSMRALTNGL